MIWGLAGVIAVSQVAEQCKARDIAAPQEPGPWKWPMSEDARKWVEGAVAHGTSFCTVDMAEDGDVAVTYIPVEEVYKLADEPEFNRDEHDRFMRGLG